MLTLTNQVMLESNAYKTYYAFASEGKAPKPKSKKDFHISHASGSSDGLDTQSKVPDQQQPKTSSTDEGTGTIPGVLDVPTYESESEKESWGDKSDRDEIPDPNKTNEEHNKEEEYNDEFNIEEEEKIDDEESMDEEEDDESGFEQDEEDVHVTLTPVLDT
ncbi:hypothetical protein Tco_0050452 [Tanacetum coccineum]